MPMGRLLPFLVLHVLGNGDVRDRPPRETLPYLMVRPEPDATMFEDFGKAVHQVHVRICYCSVFDECWLRDSGATRPTEVKVCPTPKVPFTD